MAAVTSPVRVESKRMTIEAYLRTSYSPDCDFVDGVIDERHLGELPHNRLQILIGSWFVVKEQEWNIRTVTEQRIRVTADRVRICDLCVLSADAPRELVTVTPPLLCLEILSPEDRLSRARIVLEDYRLMGAVHSWLIDPFHRCAYVYDVEGLHLLDSTKRLELHGTPSSFPSTTSSPGSTNPCATS